MNVKAKAQDFRNFFINYICNRAISAITDGFEPICYHSISGTEGIIRAFQHGDIVFCIAYAHQDLFAQLLLQLAGSGDFGHTLCVDIDDAGCGAVDFHLVAPQFQNLCLGGIELGIFLLGNIE